MDPETIAAAIQAAVAFFQQQKDTDWKNSVSDKLDLIISKLDEIDQYLHAIPGIFITLMDAEQRKIWVTQIKTAVKDINDLIKASPNGPTSSADQRRWQGQLDSIKTLVEDNMDYTNWGFEQFAIIAVGISAASGIAKFPPNKKLFKLLIKTALSYYKSAIDAQNPGSFASVQNTLTSEQANLALRANPLFEKFWNTGLSDDYGRPHGPTIDNVYLCHGSVEKGVTSVDHDTRNTNENTPFMPGTIGPDAENQGIAILTSSATKFKLLGKQIASAQQCVAACNSIIADLQRL